MNKVIKGQEPGNKCLNILIGKINNKTAVVGVVGLGYVGLPLAVEKARMGFKVIGIEQNPERAAMVNRGQSYISGMDSNDLQQVISTDSLTAVSSFDQIQEMDVIVICVPTPLTKNLTPDLQYVEQVSCSIADRLRPGQLVTLESTTYPGTTQEVILPILNRSGLTLGEDFFLAHSPERVDPGNQSYGTKNTSKIVGGVGKESLEAAVVFYSQTIEKVIPVSSSQTAEMAKVFENTFRAVNIALVNEMTLLCSRMGLNVWEVLDAAFTKPFGIIPFYPGPGVGGHCIPIDPHYLEWKAREYNFQTHFIALAGEINRKMPEYVYDKTMHILNLLQVLPHEARILIIGAAYKKDIKDERESPAIEIIRLLKADRIDVVYHDPLIENLHIDDLQLKSQPLTAELASDCDLTIIVTDHSQIDYDWLLLHARHVFDTRNATRHVKEGREKLTLL